MKILLVQTSFLGDTILSTPLIGAIKARHPDSELWMMTTPLSAPLVREDPCLHGVIEFDKRGKHSGLTGFYRLLQQLRGHAFDSVYSLHRSGRTSLLLACAGIPLRIGFQNARFRFLYHQRRKRPAGTHEVERNLALIDRVAEDANWGDLRLFAGVPAPDETPPLEGKADQPYVVLVPGSEWRTKRWSIDGFRGVAREYLEQGFRVILLGAPKEREIARQVADSLAVQNLVGRTSMAQSMRIVRDAALVVCNDSMMLHMAAAFKVPTVSIFCATSPAFGFGPWRNEARVVERKNLWCRPCHRHGSSICPTGMERCIHEVTAQHVISAGREILGERR